MSATVSTISTSILSQLLDSKKPPLLLDVRRQRAFVDLPDGLPGAIPVFLDADPIELPDVDRDRPLVAYCL